MICKPCRDQLAHLGPWVGVIAGQDGDQPDGLTLAELVEHAQEHEAEEHAQEHEEDHE